MKILASPIPLYLDENVEIEVARQMRSREVEAVTVRDLGLRCDADANHLERAALMGYVLCTYDVDYLRLHAQGAAHAGIIFAHRSTTTIGGWVHALELICAVYTPDDMKNRVEYL